MGLEQKPSPQEFLQMGTIHWFPPGSVFQPGQQYEWNREPHTLGPLSVSCPRRRTRCASLWSTVPVKRLACTGSPTVCPPATRTAARQSVTHPSSTWASFRAAIGWSGFPSSPIYSCRIGASQDQCSAYGPRLGRLKQTWILTKSRCALLPSALQQRGCLCVEQPTVRF